MFLVVKCQRSVNGHTNLAGADLAPGGSSAIVLKSLCSNIKLIKALFIKSPSRKQQREMKRTGKHSQALPQLERICLTDGQHNQQTLTCT